jgi:hypothetical protein
MQSQASEWVKLYKFYLVEESSSACGMCGGEVKCIHGFGGEV